MRSSRCIGVGSFHLLQTCRCSVYKTCVPIQKRELARNYYQKINIFNCIISIRLNYKVIRVTCSDIGCILFIRYAISTKLRLHELKQQKFDSPLKLTPTELISFDSNTLNQLSSEAFQHNQPNIIHKHECKYINIASHLLQRWLQKYLERLLVEVTRSYLPFQRVIQSSNWAPCIFHRSQCYPDQI